MTYIPQLLAEYIQYQYIKIQLTYIFPIVGRIYPIQMNIKQGPNLPGLDLLGPNLPPRGPICRGPICRGPICRQGAQSAGARFAKKWQIGPQKVRGPICRQIGAGPNLPGPNLPGPNLPRTLEVTFCSVNNTEKHRKNTEKQETYKYLGVLKI